MRTDEELMEDYAMMLDEGAFAALYTRYAPLLRRVIARQVFCKSDVEDLVQHVFMQLHVARGSYRVGERVRPWLCTIAVNASRDHLRRKQRRPENAIEVDTLPVPVCDDATASGYSGDTPALVAMEALSGATRDIFRQHFLEDRPLVDIARAMGANPNTVRVRLHRGCVQLRAQLAS